MAIHSYKKTIAFQGTFGAYSHLTCKTFFPNAQYKPYPSFEDAFNAAEKNEVDLAIIPFENSYVGRVTEIHNLLKSSSLYMVGEFFLDVNHHLVGTKNSTLETLKKVYSHPQALMQCKKNIKKLNLEKVTHINTASAAKFIAEQNDPKNAAICSSIAAEVNNLKILEKNFQDSKENKTIFIALAKDLEELPQTSSKKITSLLFTVRNIPGGIYKCLGSFATSSINIIKLESYIPGGISKEAQFFISFEGAPEEKGVQIAMEELGFYTKSIKLLGTYDQAPERA
jgi:prephenate dehydratase